MSLHGDGCKLQLDWLVEAYNCRVVILVLFGCIYSGLSLSDYPLNTLYDLAASIRMASWHAVGFMFITCCQPELLSWVVLRIMQRKLLKGSSTHGLGVYFCIFEKSCIKPFVAPEVAVWSLMSCLKWCHWSQHRLRLKTTNLKMKEIWGCGVRKALRITCSSSLLEASELNTTLAAPSITNTNLWPNCQR